VVADLMDLARGRNGATFAVPARDLAPSNPAPMDRHSGAYYIRLMVTDRPGVIADIAEQCSAAGVELTAEGETLRFRARRGALTPDLRSLLSAQKR
jgi:hypothetical protein